MAANDNHCTDDPTVESSEGEHGATLDQLPFAVQFSIWAARAWVTALKLDQPFAMVNGDTLAKFDLLPAENALDAFFSIVAGSASRQIDIRCLKCRYVSPDERIFQRALMMAQAGNTFAVYTALRDWLPPAAARIAFQPLITFAQLLAQKGLRLAPAQDAHVAPRVYHAMPSVALH
ncbi:hypothetical protein [Dongia sp.]|uniref:hypothetical protein n=1 Tax=Dongia sp. TaxID=1977262 RepID=UPI0035B247AC